MRAWCGFPDLIRAAFARIQATVGTQRLFPSVAEVDFTERGLLEELPDEFLLSESFINEMKTSYFLHETLQKPTQRIINAYLNASGRGQKLLFDNRTVGWQPRVNSFSTADTDSNNDSGDDNAGPKLPRKTQPDCLVLCANVSVPPVDPTGDATERVDDNGDGDGDDNEIRTVHRVTLGEHKATHRVRAGTVSLYLRGPMAEDFMVQLARDANSSPAAQDMAEEANQGPSPRSSVGPPGQVFFARALTQTFHYMITSGTEFGYMATGETLSFLRVSRDDPTTLLYYTALFPQFGRPRPRGDNDIANPESDGIDHLAISELCGLCLLAFESTSEPARQRSINISQLAPFPKLPLSLTDDATSVASSSASLRSRDSSQGRRRRREDGDDGDDERRNDGDAGAGAGTLERGRLRPPAHRPRVPSPLKRQRSASDHPADDDEAHRKQRRVDLHQDSIRRSPMPSLPGPFDPSSFQPIRPYCTQACLRSLVREEEVDYNCPNVVLHLQALRRYTDSRHQTTHAITRRTLCKLVQTQLLDNAERDCECLIDKGFSGAIGCLFKIAVTGYGYTFVAKGVQSFDRHRLSHEVCVYDRLSDQQGLLIPVCLGLIQLLLPYPMLNCTLVTHMLLMSYAGIPLYSSKLHKLPGIRDINLDRETARTLDELWAVGLEDRDEESNGNLTWCQETGRVMKIDFDQAYVRRRGGDDGENQDGKLLPPAQRPEGKGWDDTGEWKRTRRKQQSHSTVESLLLA